MYTFGEFDNSKLEKNLFYFILEKYFKTRLAMQNPPVISSLYASDSINSFRCHV